MAESQQDSISSAKVRDLIFAYERQVPHTEPLEEYYYEHHQRAKSTGNVLSYKNFRQPELEIHNILDIEKELVKIEAHLNYYETYEKDTHVAFQEQLFSVLTNIVSIDPEGHESTIQKKKELIRETQKLATVLNLKLPIEGSHSYRGIRRTHSSVIRRDENLHSSTSIRTKEHRAILTTSYSTINSGFQSEESLNSTKDSVEASSKHEDNSSDTLEDTPEPQTVPTADKTVTLNESKEQPKRSSSVSKLKRFFSFKRDEKPEVHVTAAAYSGVTRSQSLNMKTSRYAVSRRSKGEEQRQKENIISESEEEKQNENSEQISTSSAIGNETNYLLAAKNKETTNDPSLYVETVKDIEEYREVQPENVRNVSVFKLKSLFEDNRKDTEQGNYMNFIGLLRNVDIDKKADLNKSKSLSDLKAATMRYETNENVTNVDLSQELDGDDDFEQVSFSRKVGKDGTTSTDTDIKEAQTVEAEKCLEQKEIHDSKTFTAGKVEVLKKTFEKLPKKQEESKHTTNSTTITPVVYSEYIINTTEPKVSAELKSDFQEVFEKEQAIESEFNDANLIDKNQLPVEALEKGKVEILKKTFDSTDKVVYVTSNTEKAGSAKYIDSTSANKNTQIQEVTINKYSTEQRNALKNIEKKEINQFVSIEEKVADSSEHTENNEHIVEVEQVVTPGIVDALKYTFEHLSTNNVVESNANTENSISRTIIEPVAYTTAYLAEELNPKDAAHLSIDLQTHQAFNEKAIDEPVLYNTSLTEEPDLKDLRSHEDTVRQQITERTEATNSILNQSVLETATEVETGSMAISHMIENQISETVEAGHIEPSEKKNPELVQVRRKTLKLPVELTTENEDTFNGTIVSENSLSKVPISLYNGGQIITENTESKEIAIGEAGFQSKTDSFMRMLESPSVASASGSSYFENKNRHVSSSSEVSVSYSEKKTVQNTSSTKVSQRIVSSSSSSQLSSMNYLQVLKEPESYSVITNSNPETDKDNVEIVELEDSLGLEERPTIQQDKILEEILRNGESIQNVDEEFEKLLQEN